MALPAGQQGPVPPAYVPMTETPGPSGPGWGLLKEDEMKCAVGLNVERAQRECASHRSSCVFG